MVRSFFQQSSTVCAVRESVCPLLNVWVVWVSTCSYYLLYSGCLSREKTFCEFHGFRGNHEVFSAKYWEQGIVYWEEGGAAQKFSLRNLQLSQFVFSLDMVFSPSIWYLPPLNTDVGLLRYTSNKMAHYGITLPSQLSNYILNKYYMLHAIVFFLK